MAELNVDIVSRVGQLWAGKAKQVIAPSSAGSVGILPGRVPLLAVLQPGIVTVDSVEGERKEFRIKEGFISVDSNQVEVVVEHADRMDV